MTIGRSARRMLLSVSVALIGAAALAGPAAAAPAGLAMWHDSSATEVGALAGPADVDHPHARAAERCGTRRHSWRGPTPP